MAIFLSLFKNYLQTLLYILLKQKHADFFCQQFFFYFKVTLN